MARRDENSMSGWVNFPVDDPNFHNTGEGGMFVRLVVIDELGQREYENKWTACSGGYQNFLMDESFIGDDESESSYYSVRFDYHFPWYKSDEFKENEQAIFCSIDYLAIITIGSTGWSGWNIKRDDYWRCTFDDLTEEGKILYNQFKKLYPDCKLLLMTWLDT